MPGLDNKLKAFLDKSAKHSFAWGEHDCMLEVADWLDYACGLGAASAWRGTYSSEAELDTMVEPLGGFEEAMRAEAATLGLEEATQPLFGDVALVTLAGQDKPLGAVLMPSGRWRMRTLTGFVVTADVTVIIAWSLPCRPSSLLPS